MAGLGLGTALVSTLVSALGSALGSASRAGAFAGADTGAVAGAVTGFTFLWTGAPAEAGAFSVLDATADSRLFLIWFFLRVVSI